ncbi:hypothetical protein C5167_040785 [Papaver somniferum]|uniref:Transmembrane protein n=1 Tax=Papaver somniferum TaxID=3469 RepID=A0A4Y7IJB9_PAPSO|nr:hypothetical protein C5167_040785 [Papaver somniferum]
MACDCSVRDDSGVGMVIVVVLFGTDGLLLILVVKREGGLLLCVLQLYRRIMKANQFIFGKKKNIEMMVVVVVISWDAFVFKIEPMDVAAVLGETI